MAEMLFCGVDKHNEDRLCHKRGMCTAIEDDGWEWSATELAVHILVKLPGISPEKLREWQEPEYNTPTGRWVDRASRPSRKCRLALDVENWTAADGAFVGDDTKTDAERINRLMAKTKDLFNLVTLPGRLG